MNISKFFRKEFYFQNTAILIKDISSNLYDKKLIISSSFLINKNNNKEALYNFSNNTINIPQNFYKLNKNLLQFESIEKYLKNKTLDFIIKHEFGHLNHHQSLSLSNNINSETFEYINLNLNSNYIQTNTSLDQLFDRTLSKPNPIEDFIHMNFMESYADSYAGLTSYLQDKDKSIFSKIFNLRLSQLKSLKDSNNLTIKQNINDNSIAEIYVGKLSTSRYSNYLCSKYIKENIIEQFTYERLSKTSIKDLHSLIQIEILLSLQEILKKEVENNPLFNKQFQKYLKIKDISIKNYFETFNNGIIEHKEKTYLNIINGELLHKNYNKLSNFISFHANNDSFQYSNLFSNFINKEQEEDLYKTIKKLNTERKLEKNRNGLCKYIINNFIFPEIEYPSLIKNLLDNNKISKSSTEIINSLDSDTKNYLINSYNGNPKIKAASTPQLNHYSNQELIKIFNDSLNDKNKKEFNKIVAKYKIKEISTPYLSSTLNANVLNNEYDNHQIKSKEECIFNIKNLRNTFLDSSKNITTIKSKL